METRTDLECEQILNSILLSLISPESASDHLHKELSSLGQVLQQTLHSEHLRGQLARSERVWRLIRAALEVTVKQCDTLTLRVRLLRGVVLLGRNLLSMDRGFAERLHIRELVFALLTRLEALQIDTQIKKNTFVSGFQLLANLSMNQKRHETQLLDEVVGLFEIKNQWTQEELFPAFTYIDNLFNDSDILYLALSKGKGKPVLLVLLEEYEELNVEMELNSYGTLVVRMFGKLILHESFLKFITTHNSPADMVRYLKVSQAIISSKDTWEVFELTVVLSWNFELFQKTLMEIQDYFAQKETEDVVILYGKISSCMDVLSTLSHIEHTRKFLLSYKGVELLVSLLGTLHMNVKPKSKLKDQEHKEKKVTEYNCFPHIKSMIIETLTSLVHENFEVQEQIREIHGLELVLSNCIIDDNEPFIKERAIVCLRFLLKDNDKNQEFVAKMEAKEVLPSETLDEVGFEVEIVNGKIQMKRKPKVQEI